jgi:LCP family protein required for cell wall assembly
MERISKKKYKVKNKLTKKQKIIITVSIILAIFLIIGIVVGRYIYKADGNIADAAINMMADVVGDDTPITVLVLGVSEGIETPLTDTMMLVGYNPKTENAFVLSIPRDTYIGTNQEKANSYDKINALYQTDVSKTVKAVEKLTGVSIDNYIVVKTTALVDIVDAIGGVEFDVPIDMKYDDETQNLHIDLQAGLQLIDGNKAEQLLRFRHSNPDANGKMTTYPASYGLDDYGRMRTQREFIQATAKQLMSWKNVTKIKNIATAVFDNLETDMKLSKIIGYIPSALKLNVDNLRMEQLPGVSDKINSLWFYVANSTETCELMNELMDSLGLSEKELASMYTPIKKTSTVATKTESTVEGAENLVEAEITSKTYANTVKDTTNTDTTTAVSADTTSTTNTSQEVTCVNHNWTLKERKEATCTEDGSATYVCTNCNASKVDGITKLGHDMKEISSTASTETVQGKIVYKCSRCENTEIKMLDLLVPTESEENKTENQEQAPDNNSGEEEQNSDTNIDNNGSPDEQASLE